MKTRKRKLFPKIRISTLGYALQVYEALDTPVSLSCWLLAKYGEFDQLVQKGVDPLHYSNPTDFFLDYQAVKLLSKQPKLPVSLDPRQTAMKTFIDFEIKCFQTNTRLFERTASYPGSRVDRIMFGAKRKIASILGDVPSLSALNFEFGPGANFGVRGETSVYNKVTSTLECTFAMLAHAGSFLNEFPGWVRKDSVQVRPVFGSELTFVPKDAKTERPICIEPLLNGLYQKGVGSYIRKRLRSQGVNLNDQSINQKMAARAYDGGLSTVDFRSASDSIAYALVLELLPFPWVQFLDVARSPCYTIDGKTYSFQKYSSMGNAYTFELETLIFFALAIAVCEELDIPAIVGHNVHVYGDDVIIPREAFDLFVEVSSHCGFTVNNTKSYKHGCFFESCGSDYFMGHYVRPLLLKKDVVTIRDAYYAINSLLSVMGVLAELGRKVENARADQVVRNLHRVHARLVYRIPRGYRYLVPSGAGDCGLHADFDVARPALARDGWCGYRYVGVSEEPLKRKPKPDLTCVSDDVGIGVASDGSAHPVWPMAYALYFAGKSYSEIWRGEGDIPTGVVKSGWYTTRNHTQLRRRAQFWFGQWPRLRVQWSDKAIRAVSPVA